MFAFGSPDTAFVSPRHALYPHMTVFKNVLGDLSLRGWNADEIKARTAEMEQWPWLSPIFYKACRELNEEELYLAAIARAAASKAPALLCELPDDPSEKITDAIEHLKTQFTITIAPPKTGTAWSKQTL